MLLITDGASRGNPGLAAAAYRLVHDDRVLDQHAECIGDATNNIAEYRALILGLKAARRMGCDHLDWLSDSETVVRQMTGAYAVRKDHLKKLHGEAKELIAGLTSFTPSHAKRADPRIAAVDRLANDALDACDEGR